MRGREKRGGRQLHFRSRFFSIYTWFFLNAGMVELVRFGSVQSVSDFGNRNRTELGFFLTILIGLIGFFFVRFFRLIFSRFIRFSGFFAHPYKEIPIVNPFSTLQVFSQGFPINLLVIYECVALG